tara:strand:- start:2503 stop:2817 length:315 start_codon:yes stop_codon:yes gene_type:complete
MLYSDESNLRDGATPIIPENITILASSCYGSTIYKTIAGPITLPAGVAGMIVNIVNTASTTSIMGVQAGEYLDDVLDGTDDIKVGDGNPYMHTLVCAADGRWYH